MTMILHSKFVVNPWIWNVPIRFVLYPLLLLCILSLTIEQVYFSTRSKLYYMHDSNFNAYLTCYVYIGAVVLAGPRKLQHWIINELQVTRPFIVTFKCTSVYNRTMQLKVNPEIKSEIALVTITNQLFSDDFFFCRIIGESHNWTK